MDPNYWSKKFVEKPNGKPCPSFLWFLIESAGDKGDWPFELLRRIALSPTPFQLKNPELKESLRLLGLEWLKPTQINRIRVCPAPRQKSPFRRRLFSRSTYLYSEPTEQIPRCQKLFWAWRGDQKTCDDHLEYAAMFRVQKHRKGKQKRRDNLLQLKNARLQLKRVRRANKRAKKRAQVRPVLAATQAQQQAQNDRDDLRLLRWIRLRYEVEARDSDRLEAMLRNGYVVPDEAEPQTYRPTRQGLLLIGELRKRVGRGPALT